MPDRHPSPGPLDRIETASRDEISALQLARLRATLDRASTQVAHYRPCLLPTSYAADEKHGLAHSERRIT